MTDNILFYPVFLCQIFLISFYYPTEIFNRLDEVFNKYPSDEYPRLYVKSPESYTKKLQKFKVINHLILIVGILLLVTIGIGDYLTEGSINQNIPFLYFIIQVLPFMILEYSGFAYFKLMRKADLRTTRRAELNPRRLFNFISPAVLGFAIFLIISCILIFYSMYQFQFHPTNATFIITITLILSNVLYGGVIYWNIYGKKLNPYQASKDRMNHIEVTVKSLVFMSIVASLFLIINGVVENYHLEYLESTIMSIYLQLIIFIGLGAALRSLRLENIDFEVYRMND